MAASEIKERDSFLHRTTQIDVVPSGSGFLLTVGPVTLMLDRESADEILCLLADALEPTDPLETMTPSATDD